MRQPPADGIADVLTHHVRLARRRGAEPQSEHVASWQSAI
jgi:hypothetical protein